MFYGLSGGNNNGDGSLVVWGPDDAFADTMLHHEMMYGTLGYPYHFKRPVPASPPYSQQFNTQDGYSGSYKDYPASPQLGCCDWCSDDRLGGELGECPGTPTILVDNSYPSWFSMQVGGDPATGIGGTQIPGWLFWLVGGWAVLMLLKKG